MQKRSIRQYLFTPRNGQVAKNYFVVCMQSFNILTSRSVHSKTSWISRWIFSCCTWSQFNEYSDHGAYPCTYIFFCIDPATCPRLAVLGQYDRPRTCSWARFFTVLNFSRRIILKHNERKIPALRSIHTLYFICKKCYFGEKRGPHLFF